MQTFTFSISSIDIEHQTNKQLNSLIVLSFKQILFGKSTSKQSNNEPSAYSNSKLPEELQLIYVSFKIYPKNSIKISLKKVNIIIIIHFTTLYFNVDIRLDYFRSFSKKFQLFVNSKAIGRWKIEIRCIFNEINVRIIFWNLIKINPNVFSVWFACNMNGFIWYCEF